MIFLWRIVEKLKILIAEKTKYVKGKKYMLDMHKYF
jgi:hypothetical protein